MRSFSQGLCARRIEDRRSLLRTMADSTRASPPSAKRQRSTIAAAVFDHDEPLAPALVDPLDEALEKCLFFSRALL